MKEKRLNMMWKFIQFIWFTIMLAMFLRYLYTILPNNIDSDMASEMVFAKLLSEEGTLLSENWYYSSEIRVLSTQLIFVPLFLFLEDWFTIRMTGTILCTLILLLSFFSFCRTLRIKNHLIYAGMLLCPVSHDYFSFVFCNLLYLPYIAIIFFTVSLLFQVAEKEWQSKESMWKTALLFLLSFASGMAGLRMILYLYLPMVFIGFFFWRFQKSILSVRLWIASLLMAAGAGAGFVYYKKILTIKYSFEAMETLPYVNPFQFDMLENILNAWMTALGFVSNAPISSARLMLLEILFAAWIGLICYAIYDIRKNRQRYSETNLFFIAYFVSAVFIMTGALTLLHWNTVPRYVVPVSVLTIPVVAIFVSMYKRQITKSLFLIILMLSSLWITNNYHFTTQKNLSLYYDGLPEIADFLVHEGYENGYATFWSGNVMTELSNGSLEMWVCNIEENHFQVDSIMQWLQVKEHHTNRPAGKMFVLFTSDESSNVAWKSDPTDKIIYQTHYYTVYGFFDQADLRHYL